MNEKPILFSGEMVRAILEGRKTQTRRIVGKKVGNHTIEMRKWSNDNWRRGDPLETDQLCFVDKFGFCRVQDNLHLNPYGNEDDRLWVKETFCDAALLGYDSVYLYRADGEMKPDGVNWKPSIFCTRKASRINLEITGIRVERLNDISEDDAKSEGCIPVELSAAEWMSEKPISTTSIGNHKCIFNPFRTSYARLWESINGKGSWSANPWVWVIEFKKL